MERDRYPENLSRSAQVCAGIVVGVAAISLLGWMLNIWPQSWILDNVIMGYGAAGVLLLLSSALLIIARFPDNRLVPYLVSLLMVLVVFLVLPDLSLGFSGAEFVEGLTPLSALALFLSALALLGLVVFPKVRHFHYMAGIFAVGVILIGALVIVENIYRSPMFSEGTGGAIALTTAIVFVLWGASVLLLIAPRVPVLRLFLGNTYRARLLRVLLPLTLTAMFLTDWIEEVLLHRFGENLALWSSLEALVLGLVVLIVILLVDRRTNERLVAILESLNDGFLSVDNEQVITYLNGAAEQLLDRKSEEVVGRKLFDAFPQVRGMILERRYGVALKYKRPFSFEIFIDVEPYTNWYEIRIYPYEDGFSVYFKVITERKRIEQEQHSNTAMLESIFRAAPVGIGLVSDRILLRVNDKFCELTGYSSDELIGQRARKLYPSREEFEYVGREKYRLIKEQGTGTVETRWLCKNGEILDVLLSSTPFDPDDLPAGVTFTVLDITDRKRNEKAIKHRADQLAILNQVGGQIAGSLELESILDRAVNLVRESFGYHHVGLFLLDEKCNEMVMRTRAGDFDDLFPLEHRIQLGDGMVGWVGQYGEQLLANDVDKESHFVNFYPGVVPTRSELAVPIRIGERVEGVLDVQSPQVDAFDENDVLVLETLADQISVAIQNASLYEQIRAALEEKEVLLKEIHHRVKNNLQVVNSMLSLRSDALQDPHAIQVFQDCRNSVQSIALIHESLYQSRNLANITADEYLTSLTSHLRLSFGERARAIGVNLLVDPVTLDLDTAIPCGLIVTELVTNALKHAFPEDTRQVDTRGELCVELCEEEDHHTLRVSDNGIGLPPDFDLDNIQSLGLQLTKLLAQQLGGVLEVDQRQGTTFMVAFSR